MNNSILPGGHRESENQPVEAGRGGRAHRVHRGYWPCRRKAFRSLELEVHRCFLFHGIRYRCRCRFGDYRQVPSFLSTQKRVHLGGTQHCHPHPVPDLGRGVRGRDCALASVSEVRHWMGRRLPDLSPFEGREHGTRRP